MQIKNTSKLGAFKLRSLAGLSALCQLLLLVVYLGWNIEDVGEMGTGVVILVTYMALASSSLAFTLMRRRVAVAFHFFVFLLFVAWLSSRVLLDLNSLEYLKQVTIATTGGVLLFFMIGTFARDASNKLLVRINLIKVLLLLCLAAVIMVFLSYKTRLIRTDIFYITGVDGAYQRPGNFMIMLFVVASFAFLTLTSNLKVRSKFSYVVWFVVYTSLTAFLVVDSQMIGSNAATANILAMYMLSFVMSLLAFSKKIRKKYFNNKLQLPLSKQALLGLVKYSLVSVVIASVITLVAISLTSFDVSKTRAFGFGSGENTSVNSRIDILKETGAEQIGYAPILGNVNVAYLTTGNAGRTLHNFLPNIWAELGLVGLLIVLGLFFLVFKKLFSNIKKAEINSLGYQQAIVNLWLFFVLLWLILYANISAGKEWPVMWFFVGFAVSTFAMTPNMYKKRLQSSE